VPRKRLRIFGIIVLLLVVAVGAFIAYRLFVHKGPKPGTVLDEARQANRPASSFIAADEDYFHDMDGAVPLTPEEV
jgi:flagellar basal body-associated protein FliL